MAKRSHSQCSSFIPTLSVFSAVKASNSLAGVCVCLCSCTRNRMCSLCSMYVLVFPPQDDPGGEGEHCAAGRGDRVSGGQRGEPGWPFPLYELAPALPAGPWPCRLLPARLGPLHAPQGPTQPQPGGGPHGGHDAGEPPAPPTPTKPHT